jgi:hypothetical protein
MAYCDPWFGEKVLNISVTHIESLIEPDCVTDDVWRDAMAFVCIHRQILAI